MKECLNFETLFDWLLSSYPNFGHREPKAMVIASHISYKIYKETSSSNHEKIEVL
jgi:hypothetical protein